DQHATFPYPVDDRGRQFTGRLAGLRCDDVDAEVQPRAAHVAENRAVGSEPHDRVLQIRAGGRGIGGEALGLKNVEDGGGGGDTDRVAAERVEVPDLPPEILDHVLPGDEPGDRESVAHRLAHGHDVRQHAVPLVAPHVRPGTGEPRLYLVGDVEPAGGTDDLGDRCQEPGLIGKHAVGGEQRVG